MSLNACRPARTVNEPHQPLKRSCCSYDMLTGIAPRAAWTLILRVGTRGTYSSGRN